MANKDWPIRPPYSDKSPVRYDSLTRNKSDDYRITAAEGARVLHSTNFNRKPLHEIHANPTKSTQKTEALPRHPPRNEKFEFWRQGNKRENKKTN